MKRNLSNKYIRNSIQQQQQEKKTHTQKTSNFFPLPTQSNLQPKCKTKINGENEKRTKKTNY